MSAKTGTTAVVDIKERKEAQAAQNLEKSLKDFNLPDDEGLLIGWTQDRFADGAKSFFLGGLGLIKLHQRASRLNTYSVIIEQNFPCFTERTAFKYMAYARAILDHPAFEAFQKERGGYSKALTALSICSEADLQEFDETGIILGYTPDQINKMSVVSLKKALRRAREYADQKEKAAVYNSEKTIASQVERIRDLEAQVPAETPADAAFALIKRAEDKMLECFRLLNQVPDQVLVDSELVRDALYAFTGMADRAIANLEIKANTAIPKAAQQQWEKEQRDDH